MWLPTGAPSKCTHWLLWMAEGGGRNNFTFYTPSDDPKELRMHALYEQKQPKRVERHKREVWRVHTHGAVASVMAGGDGIGVERLVAAAVPSRAGD